MRVRGAPSRDSLLIEAKEASSLQTEAGGKQLLKQIVEDSTLLFPIRKSCAFFFFPRDMTSHMAFTIIMGASPSCTQIKWHCRGRVCVRSDFEHAAQASLRVVCPRPGGDRSSSNFIQNKMINCIEA